MPVYKQALHDAIIQRLDKLGVNVILDDRVEFPTTEQRLKMEDNSKARTTRTVRTKKGKLIDCDLLVRAKKQSSWIAH